MTIASSQFLTLAKQDEKFNSYLSGKFSTSQRAICVKTFNVNSANEKVTFHIVPAQKIQSPSFLRIFLYIIRWKWLTLSLGPLWLTFLLFHHYWTEHSLTLLLQAVLGVFFIHSSVFLLNDYYDHIHGRDRISAYGGSRVIPKGWWPAYRVLYLGFALLLVGVGIGFPLLFSHHLTLNISFVCDSLRYLLFFLPWLEVLGRR